MLLKLLQIFQNKKRLLWDRQYRLGQWDVLWSSIEEQRFQALVDTTRPYMDGAAILDIGCGEGILIPKLDKIYKSYLGIDISKVAVRRAGKYKDEIHRFLCRDMERYMPKGRYDVVIFNECLNYSKDPIGLMNRIRNKLNLGGIIAVSLFENSATIRTVEEIEAKFNCIDKRVTSNNRGTWHCLILQ